MNNQQPDNRKPIGAVLGAIGGVVTILGIVRLNSLESQLVRGFGGSDSQATMMLCIGVLLLVIGIGMFVTASQAEAPPTTTNAPRGRVGIAFERQMVQTVHPGGPAERAGVLVGDRILSANGQWLNGDDAHDLALIAGAPGTQVALELLRDRQTQTITVTRDGASNTVNRNG